MTHPKTITIIGGGVLSKQFLPEIIKSNYIIGVDRGAYWLITNGVIPDIAIGDFDSVSPTELQAIRQKAKHVEKHPEEKDFTDTELAVEHALAHRPKEIIIYGALGKRLDHALGNVYLLEKISGQGVVGIIYDRHTEMRLVSHRLTLHKDPRYHYVSLLPITETINVSLTGFRYNVSRAHIRRGRTFGVSNEVQADEAVIEVHRGKALVIRSRD